MLAQGTGHQGTRELGGERLAQGTGHQGTRELGGGRLAQGTGIWYWKNGDLVLEERGSGQGSWTGSPATCRQPLLPRRLIPLIFSF